MSYIMGIMWWIADVLFSDILLYCVINYIWVMLVVIKNAIMRRQGIDKKYRDIICMELLGPHNRYFVEKLGGW